MFVFRNPGTGSLVDFWLVFTHFDPLISLVNSCIKVPVHFYIDRLHLCSFIFANVNQQCIHYSMLLQHYVMFIFFQRYIDYATI